MLEKDIETLLKRSTEALGCMCLKLVSPSTNGVPDRLILVPGGRVIFVEVKAPGKEPRKIQNLIHYRLKKLGFAVFVVDSRDGVREVLDAL